MVYRIRTYRIKPERFELFTEFFHHYLLPNQLKFGSKLVGRWVNSDKTSIMAIWEYEDHEHYKKIEGKIKQTKLHKQAQKRKDELGQLFLSTNQEFWEKTGDHTYTGGLK
ncbi:NIPSNAP family protein [Bacillus sp. Marseille-Q1617]|uniref:NIPSNAP family protein n=1 Tax=Bacillus sp. Marseille-Q1617 TaxID=2736887 RepID=UPI00158E304C|nr:NIPSNAP family protein [Bacillus sp. Marseille-Q1617]